MSSRSLLGTLRMIDGKAAVQVEDRFQTDAQDLWSALTDPARLERWIARVNGDFHVGGDVHAVFRSGWEGPGRVEVCDAPNRLVVRMSPGEDEEMVIEARIFDEGPTTRLVIEERGMSLDDAAAYGAGWQAHIEDLEAYLSGQATSEWRTRWAELTPAYRDERAQMEADGA